MPHANVECHQNRCDQAWFWTKDWQEREREADEAIAKGDLSGPFDSANDLIRHLRGLPLEQSSPI